MAFPTISDADTKAGTVTSNSTSWTLTYPTNIAAGDLLLAFVAIDGGGSGASFPAGWVTVSQTSTANVIALSKKKAVGSETGTFTMTTASEQGAWRIFRIPAATWEGTLGTDWDAGAGSVDYYIGTSASDTPNPPNFDPPGWDVEDTLWFAACSVDTSRTISQFPAGWTNKTGTNGDVSGGSNGATLGIAVLSAATASQDPGTFTISTSDDWVAVTVAVRPMAIAAYAPPPVSAYLRNAHILVR